VHGLESRLDYSLPCERHWDCYKNGIVAVIREETYIIRLLPLRGYGENSHFFCCYDKGETSDFLLLLIEYEGNPELSSVSGIRRGLVIFYYW
jgi:hypothetical protein